MKELTINGRIIAADAIRREAARHEDAPHAEEAARRALALRELLLQRAGELGYFERGARREAVTFASREAEDAVIARVLDAEVQTPQPTETECRRYYDAHPEPFTVGELLEVRHILFGVTPGTPVMALRERAEATLAELRAAPERFAERAQAFSNCPSGAQGGSLGQFGRGEMVPEFDRALFGTGFVGVLPTLVNTRYGFHIVEVVRRIPGQTVPFEAVKDRVAALLTAEVETRAMRQYVAVLAGGATLSGVELSGASDPLVQ